MRNLEKYTFLGIALFVLLGLVFITINEGCRDQYAEQFNPKDASQLEGLWYNDPQPLIPKTWFWHFSDGQLYKQTFDFGQQIIEHWYGYETRVDTLFLREMLEPSERLVLIVHFENDSTATMTDVTNEIHLNYKIKRF